MAFWDAAINKALSQFGVSSFGKNNLTGRIMLNAPCNLSYSNFLQHSALDAYSYIGFNSVFHNTFIGRYCSLAQDIKTGLIQQDLSKATTSAVFKNAQDFAFANSTQEEITSHKAQALPCSPVEIGHDVWIGANVVLTQGVKIGTGAAIGAGAVISKDVPPYAIMVGFDRHIRNHFTDEVIADLLASEWWQYDIPAMSKQVEFPFSEPQCLAQFLKDLDPSLLVPIEDKWLSFDMPQQNTVISKFTGKKVTSTEVQQFFADLKSGQIRTQG